MNILKKYNFLYFPFAFKFLSVFIMLLNILLITISLEQEKVAVYLALLSSIQFFIPIVGFGLTQSFVKSSKDELLDLTKYSKIILIFSIVVITILVLQVISSLHIYEYIYLIFTVIFLFFLVLFSEILRSFHNKHDGFILYNLTLLVISVLTFFLGSFQLIQLLVSVIFFTIFLYFNKYYFFNRIAKITSKTYKPMPVIAIRVALVNQFYNLVILIISLSGSAGSYLMMILVYKFQIIVNWQTFFWVRFDHKNISNNRPLFVLKRHNQIVKLNLIFLFFILISGLILFSKPSLIWFYNLTFDELKIIYTFLIVRTLINFYPPYEIFTLYINHDGKLKNTIFSAALIIIIILFILISNLALFMKILLIDVLYFCWRVSCKKFYN
jgi:hypothetical protein